MPRSKTEVNPAYAENLKRLRQLRRMTQAQLANAVGLNDAQMINRYETGKNGIPLNMLCLLARALDVPYDALTKDAASGHEEYPGMVEYEKAIEKEDKSIDSFFSKLGCRCEYDRDASSYLAFADLLLSENDTSPYKGITGPYHLTGKQIDVFLSKKEIEWMFQYMAQHLDYLIYEAKKSVPAEQPKRSGEDSSQRSL